MADNLSASVTADTSALRAQLALAQADLRAFGAETKKLATDIRSGGDATGVLRGQLEQVAGQFNRAKGEVSGLAQQLLNAKNQHTEHNNILVAARERLHEFGEGAAEAREGLVSSFERIQGAFLVLGGILAGGAAFHEAIADVIQLDERVTQLQRALGLEREEALRTDLALRLIGKSSEEYTAVILKLEMHLRLQEERFKELGVVTRDTHGEFLKGPEIFANALKAMQEFRAGSDQNLVALELFGRGARDMYGFMDLTAPIMERAKQLIHEYGIELDSHESMIAYRVELAALGMAGEAVGHQIADVLLPALKELASWFSGQGSWMVRAFGTAIKGVADIIIIAGDVCQQFVVTMQTTWDQIVEIMSSAAAKGKAIVTGAWGELERLSREHETRMTGITAAGEEARVQIMLAAARAMEKIHGMEGEGGAGEVHLPEVEVSGKRSYTPPDKGAKGGGSKGAKGSDDRMAQWRDDLRQQLVDEHNFFNDSKAEELAFWQQKLALVQSGSEQDVRVRRQVNQEIYNLEKSLAQQTERDAIEAANSKMQLADAVYARVRAALARQLALGKISAQQEIADERALLAAKWALDQKYFADKLGAAAQDSRERQKLQEQEALAYQKFLSEQQALNIKSAEATKAAWESIISPVKSAISSAAVGVAQGTQTIGQAIGRIEQSIGAMIITKISDTLFSKLGDLFTSLLPEALKSALGLGEAAASTATITAAITGSSAAQIAANEANTGLIVGALTAIAVKPEIAGFSYAQGGIVPSAKGGWVVPSFGDGGILSVLHRNEMVLPSHISQFVQDAAAGYGSGAGAGTTVHNWNIQAIDAPSFARFARNNSAAFVAAVNHGTRNGSMLRSS
jgi:hypothetical protein